MFVIKYVLSILLRCIASMNKFLLNQKMRLKQFLKMYAIPSIFAILSVGFLVIEKNKGLMLNVYDLCKIGVIFTEV